MKQKLDATSVPTTPQRIDTAQSPDHHTHHTPTAAIIVTATVITFAILFGLAFLIKPNVFQPTGQIIYGDSLTEANLDFLYNILPADLELASDVTIERYESDYYPLTTPDCVTVEGITCGYPTYVLYDILVPTTDFYDPTINITTAELSDYTLTPIWDLQPDQKLLSLDGDYYLDTFTSGAIFQTFAVSGDYHAVAPVVELIQLNVSGFPTTDEIFTFAQTGVTALSRRMNTKLDQVGDATYFSTYIADFLSSFDLTHTSNESSFSTSANGSNICSKPAMIDVLTDIGLDIVELTGNHNTDCGDADAISTIRQYYDLGMMTVGGGMSADDASIPLMLSSYKHNDIALLAYNLSTGGYTLDDTPGANFYTREKAQQDIATARANGAMFVIVDVQYYECSEYVNTSEDTTCDAADSAAGDQVGLFRELIDMGADIVVGTAAHQPQTFELYHDGAIYYGLGNLFFDQSDWPGTTRSLILVHYFWSGQHIQTRIVPTVYDANFQTRLMDTDAATAFLTRLISARPSQTND